MFFYTVSNFDSCHLLVSHLEGLKIMYAHLWALLNWIN